MKFVLLHEAKNEEGIRAFFTEVWELYVKVCALSNSEGVFPSLCPGDGDGFMLGKAAMLEDRQPG